MAVLPPTTPVNGKMKNDLSDEESGPSPLSADVEDAVRQSSEKGCLSPSSEDPDCSITKKSIGRKKIGIHLINHRQRRVATFHKRKCGLMKKGFELGRLTGAEVLVLAVREESLFSYGTKKLERLLHSPMGRELIAQCLTAPLDDIDEAKSHEPANWSNKHISVLQDRAGVFSPTGHGKKQGRSNKGTVEVTPSAEIEGSLSGGQMQVPLDYGLSQDAHWLHQPSFPGISMQHPLAGQPINLASPPTSSCSMPPQVQQQQQPQQQLHPPQQQQQQPQLSQQQQHQQQAALQQAAYTSWSQMKPTVSALPPLSLLSGSGVGPGMVAQQQPQVPQSYAYYHGSAHQGM